MTSASALRPLIETFLRKHPGESYVPAAIAKVIGERDVGVVRSVLDDMRSEGDVVSCAYQRQGSEPDQLFRISAGGGPAPIFRDRFLVKPQTPPRRPDAASLPSRLKLDHVAPALRKVNGAACAVSPPPGRPAPVFTEEQLHELHGAAPAVPVIGNHWRGLSRGSAPCRMQMIAQFVERLGRPAFASEIFEAFKPSEPNLTRSAIWAAIWKMKTTGRLAESGRGLSGSQNCALYWTPNMAAAAALGQATGNGGSAGNGAADSKAAAPSGVEATRPSARKTPPIGVGAKCAGPAFGFYADGILLYRSRAYVQLPEQVVRDICRFVDARAGTKLLEELAP